MSPKKRKTQKKRSLEISTEATRILRTVNDEQAFYFYEDFGKPTGENAKSLSDFLEKTKSVKLESLLFHLQRKDFKNWIEKTLGDLELARKLERIPHSSNENLRTRIQTILENRIKELRKASTTLLVKEELALASSIS